MLSPQADGSLLVVDTVPGSAASQADIKAGDIVLELNGESVAKLGEQENLARLHHSPVTLTIKRGDAISHITLTF
jgi:S1-C subfamily serine protease